MVIDIVQLICVFVLLRPLVITYGHEINTLAKKSSACLRNGTGVRLNCVNVGIYLLLC